MTKQAQKVEVSKDAKAPTHTLYHIEERKDDKAFWTEVAVVGWTNADGSINLRTRSGAVLLPDHDYQLRARKERNGAESAE
jgi:hypothetical protein